jgi:hypothetical protein
MQIMAHKNKIQNPLTLKHCYIYYIKDIDKDSKYYVDQKIYRDICEDFNKLIMEAIIDKGEFFHIPYRLGILRIKKRQVDLNNLKPNFKVFKEDNIKTKFLNEHSKGYYCRFYWNKRIDTIVRNKTAYSFIPTRFNKRYLAKQLKENQNQINLYFE